MNIRAKFKCLAVIEDKDMTGDKNQERVSFCAVYEGSEENKQWSKWTPSGELGMTITNPDAWGSFKVDDEYLLDITPAVLDPDALARKAYAAYGASTGNKNFRGDPMPTFDALPDAIKAAWRAACAAIT